MATVNFQGSWVARGLHQTLWPAMGAADSGLAQSPGQLSDKTIQFSGTWNGATAILQGSNDGSVWFGLNQPDGTPISTTVDALFQVLENTKHVRPVTSGGGGSTSVNARLLEKGGDI